MSKNDEVIMLESLELSALIDELMNSRYDDPGPFDDFTQRLLALDITRLSFDAFTNESYFHTQTALAHAHKHRSSAIFTWLKKGPAAVIL